MMRRCMVYHLRSSWSKNNFRKKMTPCPECKYLQNHELLSHFTCQLSLSATFPLTALSSPNKSFVCNSLPTSRMPCIELRTALHRLGATSTYILLLVHTGFS